MIEGRQVRSESGRQTDPVILIVEDEVLIRMMIADELRRAGYAVIEAATAREAAEVFDSGNAEVALVFSDVCMPGSMDGVGLAKLIRTRRPSVKILLTSGHMNDVECADHDSFFSKPYEVAAVIGRIRSLLGEELTDEPYF